MSENIKGDLFIGAGVVAVGTLNAPGLIEVDGSVDGVVNARSINVTANGVVTGNSTADHIRVAGKLMNTSTAHQSLLVESSGDVSGKITYGDLEIRKGGNIAGEINSAPVRSNSYLIPAVCLAAERCRRCQAALVVIATLTSLRDYLFIVSWNKYSSETK